MQGHLEMSVQVPLILVSLTFYQFSIFPFGIISERVKFSIGTNQDTGRGFVGLEAYIAAPILVHLNIILGALKGEGIATVCGSKINGSNNNIILCTSIRYFPHQFLLHFNGNCVSLNKYSSVSLLFLKILYL